MKKFGGTPKNLQIARKSGPPKAGYKMPLNKSKTGAPKLPSVKRRGR